MTGLSLRMSRLKKLINIRLGPGAAILPKEVQAVHLTFPSSTAKSAPIMPSHKTAHRIWREHLPRLKYHNPALRVVVNRAGESTSPATLTVGFANGTQETLNVGDKEGDVFKQLLEVTSATPVLPTFSEQEEIKRIAAQNIKSEEARVQARLKRLEIEREERLLAQARGQIVDAS